MSDEHELAGEIEQLEDLLKEQPDSERFTDLGEALVSVGRFADAVKVCERGIGFHPGRAEGHLVYGKALLGLGDRDEGLQAFERACALKMRDVGILAQIGHYLADIGQAEVALPYLEKGLDLDGDDDRLLRLKERLPIPEPEEDPRVDTERISIDRVALEAERPDEEEETAEREDEDIDWDVPDRDPQEDQDMRVPTEEIQWPGWDSHPPPATDAFGAEEEVENSLDDEEEDEPPTVYDNNPLTAQQPNDPQEPARDPIVAEAIEEQARVDQETMMDPSAGLRAEIDDAMTKASAEQKGEPPTMFDSGQGGLQPWEDAKPGERDPSVGEPPTMFEGAKEAAPTPEPPPTRFSTSPDGAIAPFREAVAAPAEHFSYTKVFLVLIPFLVAGLGLGGYVAYRHIQADKIANLIDQAKASISMDTFLGYSDARMTLNKAIEISEENLEARALLALAAARLSDEYGPNIGLQEEARELVDNMTATPDTARTLLWARFHLGEDDLQAQVEKELSSSGSDADLQALAGELAFRQGDMEKAAQFLEKSHAKNPSNIRTLYLLARVALDGGARKKGMEYLERALSINGIHVRCLLLLSKLRIGEGKALERAKSDLEKVVELPRVTDERRAEAHFLLARLAFGSFDRSHAVNEVKAAMELVPDDIDFQARLALLCMDYYELDEAAARAEAVLKEHPDDMEMRLLRIGTYLPRGKGKMALAALDELVGKRVPAARFLVLRGEALLQAGRYNDALNDLEGVPVNTREKRKARALSILALLGLGENEKAYREATALVKQYPKYALAHFVLGRYRQSKRLNRSASAAFKKAGQLEPRCYRAFTELAWMAYAGRERKEALEFAKKALKANPHTGRAWQLVGQLKLESGDPAVALPAFSRVVTEDPQAKDGFVGMAECLLSLDQNDNALKAIKKAFGAGADDAHAYYIEGRIHLAMNKFFPAVRALTRANKLDDRNPEILADLGLAQLGTRSITRAEKSFKDSLKRRRLPRAQEGYARAMGMRRKYKDAAKAYEKAAVYARNNGWPATELARLYKESGKAWVRDTKSSNNLGRARRAFRKAAEADPKDTEALYELAAAYDRDDKLTRARKAYLDVLKLDGNHAQTLYRLGLLEYDQENDAKAKEYLEKFVKTGPKGRDLRRAKQILRKIK